ncbi:MAG: hypothetical protein ABW044_08305 [Cellvibrio sp.]
MSDLHKSLRLGDLLVEKGLISSLQLRQAINLQKSRHEKVEISSINTKYELGEILIELGYISRHQLNTNLSWQKRLKATTAMMVFVAPLLTAACGGGGGSAGNNANNQTAAVATSQATQPSDSPPNSSAVSSSISSSSALSSSSKSSNVSSAPKSSFASSSVSSGNIDGAVQLLWSVPTEREDGEYLDITEIGGYEIRYKLKSDVSYQSLVINDAFADSYYFDYLKGDYQFEIATFDNTGLYSKFVPVGSAN